MIGWIGSIFLAIAFGLAGVSKLAGVSAMRWSERFVHWGYPARASYVVGAIEILGAVGLLIPWSRRAASLILGAVMIGAIYTHIVNGEFQRVVPPLVLGGLAFLLAARSRRS